MSTSENGPRQGFLGVREVAKLLDCSPRTIYSWISQGTIPYRKAGRRVLFDEAEVRSWTKPDSDLHRAPILTRR
jgi:excisionase family DNA binding protein